MSHSDRTGEDGVVDIDLLGSPQSPTFGLDTFGDLELVRRLFDANLAQRSGVIQRAAENGEGEEATRADRRGDVAVSAPQQATAEGGGPL